MQKLTVFSFFSHLVSVGVSAVLIFFISVYNSATAPRQLDWAAFINLAAVVLSIIAAILLSIYDYLLEKPVKYVDSFLVGLTRSPALAV